MKVVLYLLLAVFTMGLLGCASVTVQSDFDPEYDFKAFKTYRWATEKEINPNDELAKNPLIYKRVQEAVDKELAAKGLNQVESGQGDLVILIHAGVKERQQVHQTGGYYGGYRGWYDPWWGPYGGSTHVSHYEEGTLVIDMVVWETKEMAWRGMGTKILNDYSDPDKVTEVINAWVAKIMAEYPPK